jgi:hypothetical protein
MLSSIQKVLYQTKLYAFEMLMDYIETGGITLVSKYMWWSISTSVAYVITHREHTRRQEVNMGALMWTLSCLIHGVGLRLKPLGKPATAGPIAPASYDRRVWSSRWNENRQKKPKNLDKSCQIITFPTTWPEIELRSLRWEAGDWPPEVWNGQDWS